MRKSIGIICVALLVAALCVGAFAAEESNLCPHCEQSVQWMVWDGSPITESGHYYLDADVTLADAVVLSGLDVVLDLRDHTVFASETVRAFNLENAAKLSVLDTGTQKTGTLKGAPNSSAGAGTIYAVGGSVLNLYSGTITGGTTSSYNAEGGTSTSYSGGNLQFSGSTFNMYGGTVSDGKASLGGNISLFSSSVVNMYAGTITGGKSSYVNANALNQALRGGGNVYINSDSVVNMYGGTMSDGSACRVGGNISVWAGTFNLYGGTVSGGTTVATEGYTTHSRCGGVFVYRGEDYGSFYMYGGKLDTNLCYYGTATDMIVYNGMLKNNPVAVVNSRGSATTANVLADCACYTTDGTYYTVWHTGDNTGLCTCGINYTEKADTIYTGTHTFESGICTKCGDTEPEVPEVPGAGTCDVCDKDVVWTAWDGKTRPASGDHLRLTASATMEAVFTVAAGETICVDLNGYTVAAPEGARAFYVEGNLNILDSSETGTIVGNTQANAGATIYVASTGTLTLYSGTVSGGTADGKNGGNIYSTGTLNLYGGTVTGGTGLRGGNVYATKTLNIKNATITAGNATERGGNVGSTGTVNIYEGSVISDGVAEGYGGNIYSANVVNIYGGTITGGHSISEGGGNIGLLYADLTMTGGVISDPVGFNIFTNGTASGGNCTVHLNGGKITGGDLMIHSGNHSIKTAVVIDGGYIDDGVILIDSTLAMYSGYLKTMNTGNCSGVLYGGIYGMDPQTRIAPCACAYENADGTYTIWHPVLTDGVCSECGQTYKSDANAVHVYEPGDETGTCVCKYCDNVLTGAVAVTEGKAFDTLTEALASASAGSTVTMLNNATANEVLVSGGVILDLNGHTLTADVVSAAFTDARIVDSKQNGTLAVAPENVAIMHAGNKLPVSTEGGIRFAEVTYDHELEAVTANKSKFKFHFTQDQQSLLARAVTENGGTDVTLNITVSYLNAEGIQVTKTVEVSGEIIAKYTSAWGKKQFVATITGTEGITELSCGVTIASCGVGVNTDTCSIGKEALDNKRVIFFGNSFTFYGKCVVDKGQTVFSQSKRENDKGQFYQICKANGIDVSVTNFTFGGHSLEDQYSGCCGADRGHDGLTHLDYITDWNYDYVVLQNGSRSAKLDDVLNECKPLMDRFRAANPDVKFVFLIQHQAYFASYNWLPSVKNLEEAGVIVVDWGKLVYDIATGAVEVPGALQTYNKNSFVVAQSASDGYHQNLLGGYITALAAYCAITGEKAEGQVISYGENDAILGADAVAAYKEKYYKPDANNTYDYSTNFDAILASPEDMLGIQKLIDQYITEQVKQ